MLVAKKILLKVHVDTSNIKLFQQTRKSKAAFFHSMVIYYGLKALVIKNSNRKNLVSLYKSS